MSVCLRFLFEIEGVEKKLYFLFSGVISKPSKIMR